MVLGKGRVREREWLGGRGEGAYEVHIKRSLVAFISSVCLVG